MKSFIKKFASLTALTLLAVCLGVFRGPAKTSAISGNNFQPGNIIADSVFFNSDTMSTQDIQNFLNAKVPTCDTNGAQPYAGTTAAAYGTSKGYPPPYICLKDYSMSVPATAADAFCIGAITAGTKSAAAIIKEVASACSINPEVLIVTLQKEQGLVTDDWPWPIQYRSAMGYGCPDTAACDSQYYGLFNQIYNAAHQFQRYAKQPQLFNYSAGQTSFVAYNPNASCGGTNIGIQDQATADLYNYTPYQPNAAALANLNGTGDACSAYGNRNFWRYFWDWFGPTISNLVMSTSGGVYLIENGVKRAFPSELIFLSYSYSWSDVATISDAALSAIPDGLPMEHFREGQLIRGVTGGVYLVENATKRAFPSELIFLSNSYQWSNVKIISDSELAAIPDGSIMTYQRNGQLVSVAGGGVYHIENATKRAFPSELIFLSNSYKWADVKNIDPYEISLTPDGAAMSYNTGFREGNLVSPSSGGGVYLVDSGLKRPIASEIAFLSYSYKWSYVQRISATELSFILDGAAITYNVHFRDGQLVKSSSSGGIYLIENGLKRPFPSATIFLNDSYKWSDVVTISSAEVSLIPDGAPMN